MRIINVITRLQGIINEVKSFGVWKEQESQVVVDAAEKYFTDRIKNSGDWEDPDEILLEALDNGYFEYGDFETTIIWSEV